MRNKSDVKILMLLQGYLLLAVMASAQAPAGYYSAAEDLLGQNLRSALHNIIDNHASQSYNSLWTYFEDTDMRANGTVWDIYSDIPGGQPPYEYSFGDDQCGNYSGEGDCYNREHSVPASWFNDDSPMYTDLFHLYPTDGYVNNIRGNLPYSEVSNAEDESLNGSKRGISSATGYSGMAFEPIDEYKGDLARSYFYMMTRYDGQIQNWSSPMLQGGDLSQWAVDLLLQWHEDDPVSQKELDRNNAIYAIQNNRNPFIDEPYFAEKIYDESVGLAAAHSRKIGLRLRHHTLDISGIDGAVDRVRLISSSGQTVYTNSQCRAELQMNSALSGGIYLVQIADGKALFSKKIYYNP